MRVRGVVEPLDGVVLRRRSYPVLYWGGTALPCGAAVATVALTFGRDEGGDPFLAVASCLGLVVLARRIMGSRLVLGKSALTVVDPLRVHHVPYPAIREVSGEGGALVIELTDGEELRPVAFGASLVDQFVGSSKRAAREIRGRLEPPPDGADASEVRAGFRRDWVSEVAAVAALVLGTIALLIGV